MVAQLQEVTSLTATAIQADQLEQAAFDAKKVAQHVVAMAYEHTKQMLADHAGASSSGHVDAKSSAPTSDPTNDPYSPSGGYVDQLAHLIEDVENNPNDPNAVASLVNFLRNMPDSEANDPTVVSMLKELNIQNSTGSADNLQNMINEMIELAYVQGGQAAAQELIQKLSTGPFSNSTYAEVIGSRASSFDLAQFAQEHTDANGNFIWTIPNPNGSGTITYTWDPNNAGSFDNFAIMQIIGNQTVEPYSGYGNNGTNPYVQGGFNIAQFMQQYRIQGINQIWNQTHNLGLLVMYLMSTYDNDYQSQQGGLANTTNLLSDSTNNVANPLLTIAQSIGTMTDPTQAAEFAKLIAGGAAIFGMAPQLSGNGTTVAQDWVNNVLTPIAKLGGMESGQTIGQDIQDVLNGKAGASQLLMEDLNALNPQDQQPQPNTGFQTIISAIQSGSGEITGTSKTVSTQLSLVTNQDTQVLKLGSSMATADGGGWVQLINQIINNQISR